MAERELHVAILRNAVNDFVKGEDSTCAYRDACDYLFGDYGNFQWLAGQLGLDVIAVREGVLERRTAK